MNTRKAKWLIGSVACVALLFLTVSAWSNFTNYQAAPSTETNGHLGETGTSDGGVTAWTYARYYGPPARSCWGGSYNWVYPIQQGYVREEYPLETRTYISTGALFSSSTNWFVQSHVDTDYSSGGTVEAYGMAWTPQ